MANPDVDDLDEVIHGRLRLGIMAYLASAGSASFTDLKRQTGATDGNLSAHLKKLEAAGYIAIDKRFEDRKPHTSAELTKTGREAWMGYLERLRAIIGPTPGEGGH